MLEGVDVVMEAEEKDLSVGVVCKKKDEERGPCGSAAHLITTTTINHWKGRRERRWQSKR